MKSIDVVPTWYWPDGVPRYLSPPRSTVYRSAVERWARRTPDSPALVGDGARIDYRTLDERVKAASGRLRAGAGSRPDDKPLRVAVTARPGIDAAVVVLGALHAGADTLLLEPATPAAALSPVLGRFGGELLVTDDAGHGGNAGSAARSAGPWTAIGVEALAAPAGDRASADVTDRSSAARLGFRWGESVVLQPNAALLGWALAFRAFAMLDKADRFTVLRPFSTWEGTIGLLAPLLVGGTAVLPSGSWPALLGAPGADLAGVWLDWPQAEALAADPRIRDARGRWQWVYVSVEAPFAVRTRRRLGRLLGSQILTVLGTPATGPVAASPRAWLIDEAVGTAMTGVDLFPVDAAAGRLASPPWALLASAAVGVKSAFIAPEMSVEPSARARFVADDVLDTGFAGLIDANGFLYLA